MIILTREEAQQILDALQCATPPTFSTKLVEDWQSAVETLRARLAQPDGNCNGMPAYEGSLSAGQRLAQPEPEPVAWGITNTRPTEKEPLMMVMLDKPEPSHLVVPLYTAPPQREWQGLTDDELSLLWADYHGNNCLADGRILSYERAIEAKLKEKNT